MTCVSPLDMDQVTKRIEFSTAFLQHTRANIKNSIESLWVQVALSSAAAEAFKDEFPDDAMKLMGYRVFILNKNSNRLVDFIENVALPKMGVGSLGSIFTDFFKYEEKDYKVTLSPWNPITGEKHIYYFDVCSLQDY